MLAWQEMKHNWEIDFTVCVSSSCDGVGLFKRKHNVLEAASIFTVTHIFRCTFHFVPVYARFDRVRIFLKYVDSV